ncbi:uncharacterized protein [Heterodontus francisci]|uniref:uncharacterized protein n=1 Tax=Heterodontus francisci TaxID=7792 RepID=UPI00355C9A02
MASPQSRFMAALTALLLLLLALAGAEEGPGSQGNVERKEGGTAISGPKERDLDSETGKRRQGQESDDGRRGEPSARGPTSPLPQRRAHGESWTLSNEGGSGATERRYPTDLKGDTIEQLKDLMAEDYEESEGGPEPRCTRDDRTEGGPDVLPSCQGREAGGFEGKKRLIGEEEGTGGSFPESHSPHRLLEEAGPIEEPPVASVPRYPVVTVLGGTAEGSACRFPFLFRGKEYTECTEDGSEDGRLWCAVADDYEQDKQLGLL